MVKKYNLEIYKSLRDLVKNYDKYFKMFLDDIISRFQDEITVILFGSRVSGKARESSDYDVAIIVRDDVDRIKFMEEISTMRKGGIPIDIVVLKKSEIKNEIIKKMLTPSKIIWDGLRLLETHDPPL